MVEAALHILNGRQKRRVKSTHCRYPKERVATVVGKKEPEVVRFSRWAKNVDEKRCACGGGEIHLIEEEGQKRCWSDNHGEAKESLRRTVRSTLRKKFDPRVKGKVMLTQSLAWREGCGYRMGTPDRKQPIRAIGGGVDCIQNQANAKKPASRQATTWHMWSTGEVRRQRAASEWMSYGKSGRRQKADACKETEGTNM